jgi:ubiquitin C-terminal hydrolase
MGIYANLSIQEEITALAIKAQNIQAATEAYWHTVMQSDCEEFAKYWNLMDALAEDLQRQIELFEEKYETKGRRLS